MARSLWVGALLAGGCCVLGLPGTAHAQSREDDVEFALGLADRGYFDLAQAEIDALTKGNASPEKQRSAEYLRGELLRRALLAAINDSKSKPSEVREKFAAAKKGFQEFIANQPENQRRFEAQFNLAQMLQDVSDYLVNNLEDFPGTEQEGIRKEADKGYEEAVGLLRAVKENEERKPQKDDDPSANRIRNWSWYLLCEAMVKRGAGKPPGDVMRVKELTDTETELLAYYEETDGTLPGFLGAKALAECYWKRAQLSSGWNPDDLRQANEWFGIAVGAVDQYRPPIDPGVAEIALKAAMVYGRFANEVGKVGEVSYPLVYSKKMTELETKLPQMRQAQFGLRALVEKGRAFANQGQHQAGIDELTRVSNEASKSDPRWGRGVDSLAKRALNDVIASLPPDSPVRLSPDVLMKAGDGSRFDRKWGRALRAYQKVVLACEAAPTPEQRKALVREWGAKAWGMINGCYTATDRYLEAFLAADVPVQQYLAEGRTDEDQDVGWCAYYRIIAKQELAKAAKPKDPKLEAEVAEARKLFVERFPWSEAGGDQRYQAAVQALNGNDLPDAIEKFKQVKPDSPNYDLARVRIGEVLVKSRQFPEALAHLQGEMKRIRPLFEDSNVPAGKKQPYAVAVFWIANAHDGMAEPAKVVEDLADFERKFAQCQVENFFSRVRYLRVTALVAVNRDDDAEKVVQTMEKEDADSQWTSGACWAVAEKFRQRAEKLAAEGDKNGAKDLLLRAKPLYEYSITRTANPGADNLRFLGQVCMNLGDLPKATEYLQRSREKYRDAGKAKEVEDITLDLAQILTDQGRFPEALPELQALLPKPQEDTADLKECYKALVMLPTGQPEKVFEKWFKERAKAIVDRALKDPGGAGLEDAAEKAAALATPAQAADAMLRAFERTPESRRALAGATALTILEMDGSTHRPLRAGVLALIKRSPSLLSSLAACYDKLSESKLENCIAAVNVYDILLEGAPTSEKTPPEAGSRYSLEWFDWKLRKIRVFLRAGVKSGTEEFLFAVCAHVKAMENVSELKKADEVKPGMSKEFLDLRMDADAALRKLGKAGCK